MAPALLTLLLLAADAPPRGADVSRSMPTRAGLSWQEAYSLGRKLHHMGIDQAGILEWTQGWIRDGFDTLEPMVAQYGRGFAFGDTPTLADCCLIPQVYSANRYEVDLTPYPAIQAVNARALEHPAFQAAHPNKQPDAVLA